MKSRLLLGLALFAGVLAGFWLAQSYHYQAGELRLIPTLRLADGSVYAGDVDEQGLFSGAGRLDWANGRSYVGEFRHGLFNGFGKYMDSSGLSAEGQFEDGFLSGSGRVDYVSGTEYEGEFQRDLMHGFGKLSWPNGQSWQGDFSEDLITGSGTWTEADGSVYVGQMEAAKFHGHGEITYADNGRYVGEFRQGERHGQGAFTTADGIRYNGDFVDNKFSGSGIISWPDDRGEYVGEVVAWQPHGEGVISAEKGQLVGFFEAGRLEGPGQYLGANGQRYDGEFENGQYSGQGVWLDSNGDRFEGEFEYGDFNGQGHYRYAQPIDGVAEYSGIWEWGRLISGDDRLVIHPPEAVVEHFLYQQSGQLISALDELQPGDSERIELYTLALAPFGDQEVFNREINYLENQFKEQFGGDHHGVFLSNSRRNISRRPMATVTAMQRGLDAIAANMDVEQDILFLYLTTHGSENHSLSFDQSGMDLPDLSANQLGDMLDASGIKWKVVVISACYSGGFINRLKNDNTLIFTAAAADKTSFGCDDNNEFTYFGDAFFRHGLAENKTFSLAFEQATVLIEQWEQAQELEPSNPQSHQPRPIQQQLKKWRSAIASKRARAG